jgi:hypothetical protein
MTRERDKTKSRYLFTPAKVCKKHGQYNIMK